MREKLPAGDYTVNAHLWTADDAYIKEISYNNVKFADRTLLFAPGGTGTLRILIARGCAALAVKATDSDEQAIPGASLLLIPASATSPALLSRDLSIAQADQNGTFVFRNLPPGKYRVLATTQSISASVPEDMQKLLLALFQAKEIELGDKDRKQLTVAPIMF